MDKIEHISASQLIWMILVNRFLFGFSFMPTVTIAPANQDAWITELLSGALLLLIAIPMLILASRFRGMSFNEYFQVITGKTIGKIICVVYALYLVFITMLTVLFTSDFMLSAVLPETPLYAIILFMLIPCIYASYKGLECLARSSLMFGMFIVLTILLYSGLNLNNMDFKFFFPMLSDSTPSQMAFGVFNNASRFSDCFLFFLFIAHVSDAKKQSVTKILVILVVAFTLLNTLITISTQAVLGIGLAKTLRYPYFVSIQQINLLEIIQRVEFFNLISWIFMFFFKIATTILAAAMIMAQVFKIKSYKPFIIPMNVVIVLVVLLSSVSYYSVFRSIFTNYAYLVIFVMNFIIPSSVLGVYYLRRKSFKNIGTFDKFTEVR